ncbi:hypothetical protein AB0L59_24800 [Streptomyces sp. NPDC052109]|uniref:hypothetical protein n=1 Tax=Streptomyces sp. NPDC052109 TaxID=3155527 RepID=UPI0034242A22
MDPADVQARAERELCIVILQAVQDAHEKKRKGIHIADLLDQLREEYTGFDEWDVTTTLGIRIPEALSALRNAPLPRPAAGVQEEAEEGALTTPAAAPDSTGDEAVPTTLIARHLRAVSDPSPGEAA